MNEMILLMSNTKGFKLFVQHVVLEYDCDSILFIVELIQIKYKFQILNNNLIKVPLTK